MKLLVKILLIGIAVILLTVVLILGYYGFMPGVSSLFGSNKPRDLSITYSTSDLSSAKDKSKITEGVLTGNFTPAQSIEYSGQNEVSLQLTSAELTASLNDQSWKYFPLSNSQIKFNDDNTVEFSALLLKNRLPGYLEAIGATADTTAQVLKNLKYLPANPPIYLKFFAEGENNTVSKLTIYQAQVGRFTAPNSLIERYTDDFAHLVEKRLSIIPKFDMKEAKVENNIFKFNGTLFESFATAR
ncbi:hypothetical protein KKB83_02195 [Patescibacteria group bacterium]|nr:hypothetical protein [Patescibacteria group bacterium]